MSELGAEPKTGESRVGRRSQFDRDAQSTGDRGDRLEPTAAELLLDCLQDPMGRVGRVAGSREGGDGDGASLGPGSRRSLLQGGGFAQAALPDYHQPGARLLKSPGD